MENTTLTIDITLAPNHLAFAKSLLSREGDWAAQHPALLASLVLAQLNALMYSRLSESERVRLLSLNLGDGSDPGNELHWDRKSPTAGSDSVGKRP